MIPTTRRQCRGRSDGFACVARADTLPGEIAIPTGTLNAADASATRTVPVAPREV
ncbi:hypothetical protein I546_2453 [Mycobacterium kansasii 732]|nr:hypothetical protein I546_2453 [Mycobacterium kansasii 732]